MDKKIYNSAIQTDTMEIKAFYYNAIDPTEVCFEQEKIFVTINSLGHIEFYDAEKNSLGFVDFPVSDDPSKYAHTAQYGEIRCASNGKEITVFLPIYWWDDSYPHCDGESDRWIRHTDRWFRVVFDCENKKIEVMDK